MIESRPVESIVLGERIRGGVGDVATLAQSIRERGLLQPIVVRSDGTLIAGARRLAAHRELGFPNIAVYVRDDLDGVVELLEAERDENTERLDFKPSEKVALGRQLEALEKPKAEERVKAGRPPRTHGNLPRVPGSGPTRDKVAAALGMSGRTYERARSVVEAAEQGDSAAKDALEEMDVPSRGTRSLSVSQLFPATPVRGIPDPSQA